MKISLKKVAVSVAALSLVLAPAANAATLKASGSTFVAGLVDKCKVSYQKTLAIHLIMLVVDQVQVRLHLQMAP